VCKLRGTIQTTSPVTDLKPQVDGTTHRLPEEKEEEESLITDLGERRRRRSFIISKTT